MKTIMQIFVSFVLLLLAFPTIGATLGSRSTNVGVRMTHGVREDAIKTNPRAFLPYIFGSVHNLPSALDATGGDDSDAGVAPESSPPDLWKVVKESEESFQEYVHSLLETAATYFNSTKFTDITSTMTAIVGTTATFRDDIAGALDAHNITFDMFSQELEGMFTAILSDLENIPSPDQVPDHAERVALVDRILDDTGRELTDLATRFGIDGDVVTTFLSNLKPPVQSLVVLIGDINEQCPGLFPALAFSVATLLIPEDWILKPLLTLFGFGPLGPVKGSAAALLQSKLWGPAVESGSWFSQLQAAGMGVTSEWLKVITTVPLLVGGLLTGFSSCFNHE